ncbi:hypothetical protein BJY52DRAFT_1277594 [Lactarius psammicola]|nr:hypothetical protein BJY52DRAFT_1277594 [Lactarius psammicola]
MTHTSSRVLPVASSIHAKSSLLCFVSCFCLSSSTAFLMFRLSKVFSDVDSTRTVFGRISNSSLRYYLNLYFVCALTSLRHLVKRERRSCPGSCCAISLQLPSSFACAFHLRETPILLTLSMLHVDRLLSCQSSTTWQIKLDFTLRSFCLLLLFPGS